MHDSEFEEVDKIGRIDYNNDSDSSEIPTESEPAETPTKFKPQVVRLAPLRHDDSE